MQMRSLIRAKYKSEKPGEYLCLLSEDPPPKSPPRSAPHTRSYARGGRARNTVESDYATIFGDITGKPLTESINLLSGDIGIEIPRAEVAPENSNKISRMDINLVIIEKNSKSYYLSNRIKWLRLIFN